MDLINRSVIPLNEIWKNDFWILKCEIRWHRTRDDIYDSPKSCICQSRFAIFEEHCNICGGKGYIHSKLPYPKSPRMPESLIEKLEETFLIWKKEQEENIAADVSSNL